MLLRAVDTGGKRYTVGKSGIPLRYCKYGSSECSLRNRTALRLLEIGGDAPAGGHDSLVNSLTLYVKHDLLSLVGKLTPA